MTLALILTRAAQGHALIQRTVVSDLGGLTDHHAGAVVDHQSSPDGGTGVDLNAGQRSCDLAYRTGRQ